MGNTIINENKQILSFDTELEKLFKYDLIQILNEFYSPYLFAYSKDYLWYINLNDETYNKHQFDKQIHRFRNGIVLYEELSNMKLLNLHTKSNQILNCDTKNYNIITDKLIVIFCYGCIYVYDLNGNVLNIINVNNFDYFTKCVEISLTNTTLIIHLQNRHNVIIDISIQSNQVHQYVDSDIITINHNKIAFANDNIIKIYKQDTWTVLDIIEHPIKIKNIKLSLNYLLCDDIDGNFCMYGSDMYGVAKIFSKFLNNYVLINPKSIDYNLFIYKLNGFVTPYAITHPLENARFEEFGNIILMTDNSTYAKIISTNMSFNYILNGYVDKLHAVRDTLIVYRDNTTFILNSSKKITIEEIVIFD